MRWVRRVLIALAVVVIFFYAAGGWYYSERIYTDGLEAPNYWKWPKDNTVVEVSTTQITLSDDPAPEKNDDLRSDGTFGLAWSGGYGEISGSPEISGDEVTREFRLIDGLMPDEDVKVSVEAFVTPPAPLPPIQQIAIPGPEESSQGAWLWPEPSEPKDIWVIGVHGKGVGPEEEYRLLNIAHELGFPALSINYRNDKGMPRDASGQYGYGQHEWHDLESAIGYARSQGATGVVLAGASMGGGIVAAYLEEGSEPGFVKGIILDSPMLDFSDTVDWGAEQLPLPLGLGLPDSLTNTAKWLATKRYDVDWEALDYNDDASWVKVPSLVIHGTDDRTVPLSVSKDLATRNDLVQLAEFEGVDHIEAWNRDTDRYTEIVKIYLVGVAN